MLAAALRDALVAAGHEPATYGGGDGLVKRDDLGTLNRSDVPAVLLEAGNLRNPGDAAALTSAEGRAEPAVALVGGIEVYAGEFLAAGGRP